MKKSISLVFGLVLIAAIAVFAANTTTVYKNSEYGTMKADHAPNDIVVLNLHTVATVSAKDTFAAGDIHIYGPYPLCSSSGTGMFAGFQDLGDAITGTTPTMALDFQVLPSANLSDTTTWTSTDTLGTAATNQYQSLSSYAGQYIVFRVNNYDGTACQIPGKLVIMFKQNWSYQLRR